MVAATGEAVTLFEPGDEVYFAGSILRPGSNAELTLVDERIVGHKPKRLPFAEAAALPLTAITAWEALFDRLGIQIGKAATEDAIRIVGAAGGVGSIAVQLARRMTGLTVIDAANLRKAHAIIESGRSIGKIVLTGFDPGFRIAARPE